jgi:hypothetical protein
MTGDDVARPVLVSDLLGRTVVDAAGRPLGRVVDLLAEPDPHGRPRLVAALVVRGPWGRLLGYEREQAGGPWIVEVLARAVLRRRQRRVAWPDLRLR